MSEAAECVRQIEAHVAAARRMVRATLRQFLEGQPEEHSPPEAITVTAGDLERYAIEWAWLVPEESAQRDELVAAVVGRFGQEVLLGRRTTHTLQLTTQAEQQEAGTPTLTPRPLPEAEGALRSNPVDVLERGGECIVVRGGETLLRQGELSADFYVVLTGRLAAAQATDNGGERVLREMVRGTSIGELAALTGQPRAARVFAMRDSHLLRVPREAFEIAVARHPEVLRGVVRTLVAREREGQRRAPRPETRTIAIVPLHTGVPVGDFAHELVDALALYGTTRLVDAEAAAARSPGVFQGWLDGLEEAYRFVVYLAEAEASEWSARCIRQADRVFLLAASHQDPRTCTVEQLLSPEVAAPRELVLLHGTSSRSIETSRWLSHRQLTAHHHVRLHNQADVARLARRVVGRAVGLVLGGGGARAFAHIGALRALIEAGVPIDMIGGASAGAIIAAQFAQGWSVAELYARNRRLAHLGRSLIDYTVPLVSLIQARKFMLMLHELFGQTCIEDLWLPYWCLSSNLTRAEKIVHRTGQLAPGLRATCALPGVLPPVLIDGDVVVDGGLIDTVPVATMNEVLDGAGVTVAVDVSAEVDLERPYSFGTSVSGLRLLWDQVNPFGKSSVAAPSIAAVLLRSIELASVMHRDEHMAGSALFIKLPVAHVDRLAFVPRSFEQLVEVGYAHTCEVLKYSDLL